MARGSILKWLPALVLMVVSATLVVGYRGTAVTIQSSLSELRIRLQSQYAAIEDEIARPPRQLDHLSDYGFALREWQVTLASRFTDAAATVEEIVKIDPANSAKWNERLETLRIYGKPVGPPGQRTIFGSTEVEKKAKLIKTPAAIYTANARSQKVQAEVRLRLVLAADGSVKNVFPFKSAEYGLTESAMAAARKITFTPAVRKGVSASQFITLVYEFNKDNAKPYIPSSIF